MTFAELREAQRLAEKVDMPIALLVRKMLRDAANELSKKGREPRSDRSNAKRSA